MIDGGWVGPTVWSTPFVGLPVVRDVVSNLPIALPKAAYSIKINEAFMIFGAIGLGFNIAASYVPSPPLRSSFQTNLTNETNLLLTGTKTYSCPSKANPPPSAP